MRFFAGILLLFILPSAYAEIYMGIGPLNTLGEIKVSFPNARVEKLSPAWAQPGEALFMLTGVGLSGRIIIKFDDVRPHWKEVAEEVEKKQQMENDASTTPDMNIAAKMAQESDDVALTVSWVRWVPDTMIPLRRLIAKYGKPEESGFSEDDYVPYRSWGKKGVFVYLSDDEKDVVRIDYFFTRDEYRKAYLEKYKSLPEWLKDTPPIQKK